MTSHDLDLTILGGEMKSGPPALAAWLTSMPRANGGRNVRHSTTLRMLEERDIPRYLAGCPAPVGAQPRWMWPGANAATAVASGARLIWAAVRADLATRIERRGG